MTTRVVEVTNRIGLHASPASFFIQQACSFQSTIWVEKGDRKINAKSLLGLLSMGIRQGEKITLIAEGADEVAALDGLEDLLHNKLAD
jgi:phosphocarrier protein